MMLRPNFSQALIREGINEAIIQWRDFKMKDLEYNMYLNVETSDNAYEMDVEFAGLPPQVETGEGVGVTYADPIQGGSKRYTHLQYTLATRVSNLMRDDDKIGLVEKVPECHTRSAQFTREQISANVFNNGFSSTGTLTTDGLSLFNTAHPLLGGTGATSVLPLPSTIGGVTITAGTYPNAFTTPLTPSVTAVTNMVIIMRRMIDGVGIPVASKLTTIWNPPEQEASWSKILNTSYEVGTGNNDINTVLKYGLRNCTLTYLTSGTYWFATSDKADHKLKFFEREALNTDFADDFDVRGFKMLSAQRFSVGASVWYNTFGSAAT